MNLFCWTGNPFVDSGISAIMVYNNRTKPEEITRDDLSNTKELLLNLFLQEQWVKGLNTIFTSNSHVTHASASSREKKKERLEKFLDPLLEISDEDLSGDNCISCGKHKATTLLSRTSLPLIGYENSNYFSHFSFGADYCAMCAFAAQCSPLVTYKVGKFFGIIHSNNPRVLLIWAKKSIDNILRQISIANYDGIYNEKYSNSYNALFHLTNEIILSYEERWKETNTSLRLYLFNNYTQPPKPPDNVVEIHDLPASVFRFLLEVKASSEFSDWQFVVGRAYYKSKKEIEEPYKKLSNTVYQKLMRYESILQNFFSMKNRLTFCKWNLVTIYLKEILDMSTTRINSIKKIADDIAEIIRNHPNGKKRLTQLETAKYYDHFRNVLFRLVKENIVQKADSPLITFDDYVENLFPEGYKGWTETRDLILFRLYETLHQWFKDENLVTEIEEEIEEESNELINENINSEEVQ
ncbi:MAG: type I-B CRISPR-associated protein Cas8b1/Cst1 [Melioribacteraceae bacterium]|jgi:CRISPR-associated protein Cst1|nr:type I-B CRISPR-associated protein Cas8b1/Cst1 [Melioribacteraceae bacterium]